MHQTLYIDIDEEITSVVERLRKAQAKEIVMVVPKRAMLIQSIVNLRLLKKEADNLGLQFMIVTQDKLGKLLVEKAGILVQQKLDDSLEEETISLPEKIEDKQSLENIQFSPEGVTEKPEKKRLDKIGSSSFFDESDVVQIAEKKAPRIKSSAEEKNAEVLVNKELVVDIGKDIKKKTPMDLSPRQNDFNVNAFHSSENNPPTFFSDASSENSRKWKEQMVSREEINMPKSIDKVESFFQHNNHSIENLENSGEILREPRPSMPKTSKSFRKTILVLSGVLLIAAIGFGAYYFVPRATINLSVKEKVKEQDCEITGDVSATSLDYEKEVIPAKVISVSDEITQSFNTSGSKSGSSTGQKARGVITVYNEFSTSSQPLIATTRFVSEDGKIFRLVKDITVPGTKNGEAGTVDADVVADQSGDGYNIGSAKFSIPGFQNNSDKYAKIYGKSTKAMSGGNSTGNDNSSSTPSAITDTDISQAKTQIQKALIDSIKKKIKDSAGSDWTVSDDAVSVDEATYKLSNTIGQTVSSFQITAQTKANALVFQEKNLKDMVASIITKSSGGNVKMDSANVSLEYGKLLPDFRAETLDIKVHGISKGSANLNVEKFKEDILGKTNDDFEAYLSSYPDIEKVEVTYWPPFVSSKIPMTAQRVDVVLDTK
jgi:hypothetical protein